MMFVAILVGRQVRFCDADTEVAPLAEGAFEFIALLGGAGYFHRPRGGSIA